MFACNQIRLARQEEANQQLEALLAHPVGRARWLLGRLLLAAFGVITLSLTAGLFAWAGASAAGVHIALHRMLGAGANAIPTALVFLGLAALGYAFVPRASGSISYSLVTASFLWQLVGSLLPPHWLLDLTPFALVGLVPAQPFHIAAAAVIGGIGVVAGLAAVVAFRQRDLVAN